MATTTTVSVQANVHWLDTQVTIEANQKVTISASGKWSANPSNGRGLVDADGDSGLRANGNYALPGANESVLVGFVGKFPPTGPAPQGAFALGKNVTFTGRAGRLFLTINDDIPPTYGRGYPDNEGSLNVTITVE